MTLVGSHVGTGTVPSHISKHGWKAESIWRPSKQALSVGNVWLCLSKEGEGHSGLEHQLLLLRWSLLGSWQYVSQAS